MAKHPKIKRVFRFIFAVIGVLSLIAFFSIPFLSERIDAVVAQATWYPSLVIVFILGVLTVKSERKKNILTYIGDASLLPVIVIFLSAFIINYYQTNYDWHWAVFTFFAIGIPGVVFAILTYTKKYMKPSKEQYRKASLRALKIIGFWWSLDVFYLSIFMDWLMWQFILGSLSMIIIFWNLTFAFLAEKKNSRWGLLQDFIVGISITVYLLYITPNEQLQSILIPVISAVYGGLITLVGVAWTIRESQRVSIANHKESIKPLFYATYVINSGQETANIVHTKFTPVNKMGGGLRTLGAIKNLSKVEFIFQQLIINDNVFKPDYGNVIEKGKFVILSVESKKLTNTDKVKLLVVDIEDNPYTFDLVISSKEGNAEIVKIEEVIEDGKSS